MQALKHNVRRKCQDDAGDAEHERTNRHYQLGVHLGMNSDSCTEIPGMSECFHSRSLQGFSASVSVRVKNKNRVSVFALALTLTLFLYPGRDLNPHDV